MHMAPSRAYSGTGKADRQVEEESLCLGQTLKTEVIVHATRVALPVAATSFQLPASRLSPPRPRPLRIARGGSGPVPG
jgi:hypothetical protein